MKRNHRIVVGVMAALLTLALALTGCGTGGGGGTSGGTTTFNIGFGGPLTQGDVSFGQGGERATKLAIENANKSQEAKDAGIQFKVISGDDQSLADVGTTVANQFVSDKNMVGVVGHFNSTVSIAASKVYNQSNFVQISYGSTNPDLTKQGFKNVFRTCATDDLQGPTGADRANKLGFKNVAIVNDSSPYGQGLVKAFKDEFLKNGGKVVFEDATQQKQNDFTALVTKIAAAKPDLVYFGGTYAPDTGAGALFAKQLKSGGVTVPMMGGDGLYAPEFITGAGADAAEGNFATCPGMPVELLPNGKQFAADYVAMFPGQQPAPFDAYAYDAANAIINATYKVAKDLGVNKVTSPAGRDALLAAVAATDFDGVTGKVSFDNKGDNNNRVITLYKVVNGKWEAQPEQ
ncbi:MAG: branched-chain amino acid ABC transporter substrate-binding protein [Coriobacteriia bacterium]|nr:branched-chain amino acid ABC transporter substrate-binding protein [Coriobacteriia bacterium]